MINIASEKLIRHLRNWGSEQEVPVLDTGILFFLVIFCLFAPHSIAVTQGAFYAALVLWLVKAIWRRKLGYKPSALNLPLLAFVVLTVLSAVFSYEPTVSLKKLGSVSLCLIFFLVMQQVRTVRLAGALVIVMLASCMVNVAYVFWQKAHGQGLKIVQMSPDSPLAAAGLGPEDVILEVDGRSVNSLQEFLELMRHSDRDVVTLFIYHPEIYFPRTLPVGDWEDVSELGVRVTPWLGFRAAGFYGWNYFTYAEVLQLLASIAFGLLLRVREKRSWTFIFLAFVVAAMSAVIILTVTRAVWIAYASALLVMSLRTLNKRAVLIILAAGLVAAPVALKILEQTRGQPLLSTREPSTAYRLTIWAEGVNLLLSQPKHLAFGIGMDSLKYRWREWKLFRGGKLPLGHMHSTPLQVALERGIPALMCFLWWFGAYLVLLWRLTGVARGSWLVARDSNHESRTTSWVSRGIGLGIFGGIIGFLLSSLVHYNFGDSEVIMIVYFLMGVSVIMDRKLVARGM